MSLYYTTLPSPIDELLLLGDGEFLIAIFMPDQLHQTGKPDYAKKSEACFRETIQQLKAYFAGELTSFDLPLKPEGTNFRQQVWQALCDIPYGETESYGQLAARIGNPKASRAVGLANGRNPISIVIPCHRVIGANGSLTGYGGGVERKQWLLNHERQHSGHGDLFG